jgi:hypothetical protein
VQSYKMHASYKPRAWINFDGALDLHENRDNVATVDDVEHGRSYSFVTTLMPGSKWFFDLGYTYTDIYNAAQICYYANANGPAPVTQCPASLGYAPAANSGLGAYSSKQHFVGGSTLAIDALQVPGTLAFNYQKPYARIICDVYKGLSYRMTWNYYGYNGRGQLSNEISGLAPIPNQDFDGSTAEFAFRYTF